MNKDLISRIEAYCQRNNIAEATFGWKACQNYRLVARLRNGADLTTRTHRKIHEFLDADEARSEAAE